jgi:hypothetical protein
MPKTVSLVVALLLLACGIFAVLSSQHDANTSSTTDASTSTQLMDVSDTSVCDSKDFVHDTVQILGEQKYAGLLQNPHNATKFEASDVALVDGYYYVIYDSLWTIGRMAMNFPFYSSENQLLTTPGHPVLEESSFEGITYDPQNQRLYLVQESLQSTEFLGLEEIDTYRATIVDVALPATTGASSQEFEEGAACKTELSFTGDSKGLEGVAGIMLNGTFKLLGLCEGNFCSNDHGVKDDPGNGVVVLMTKSDINGSCVWSTEKRISIPRSAYFEDYSAISLAKNGKVAITSQENSAVWVGRFDTAALEFVPDGVDEEGDPVNRVYNFPRDNQCEMIYCNIEGVTWLDEGANTLVTTSDKMKSKGKQPSRCWSKDQAIQMIQLPP